MAEYIEREALLSDIQAAVDNGGMGGMVAGALKRYVKRAPAADAAPVVHGEWKQCFEDWRKQMEGDECSACGFQIYGGVSHFRYCPNCGAKMDKEENK